MIIMLPFVRMFNYGNTVAAPTGIKDFQANGSHCMALTYSGEMWAYGTSTSGSMGTGFTVGAADKGWYKSNISNVKSFSSNMETSTVALTNDDRVLVCGSTRFDKFSTPDIASSNLDWLDVTDHIPQEVIDAGMKQVINHAYYVAIFTENNLLYSVALSLGNTSTIIDRTWRRNTFGDIQVERVVSLTQTPSGPLCIVQDADGYQYGIGYNGNKIIDNTSTNSYSVYTKMGTLPYNEFAISNSGKFSSAVLSDGRSVYSGTFPKSFNDSFGSFLKVGAVSNTVFGLDAKNMRGQYGQNQLPIASADNNASNGVVNLRNVPAGTQTKDIRFICGNDVKNVYIIYTNEDGISSFYGLGPNFDQNSTAYAQFVKVDLPGALLN